MPLRYHQQGIRLKLKEIPITLDKSLSVLLVSLQLASIHALTLTPF